MTDDTGTSDAEHKIKQGSTACDGRHTVVKARSGGHSDRIKHFQTL